MNKFEKAQASALSEFNKIQEHVAQLEAEAAAVREIAGCSHPGYILKTIKALKDENQELQKWRQDFLEAANTNNLSNALKKTKSALSNEPTPPTETELAYEKEQQTHEESRIARAKTIKVFESIIETIGMWAQDGQSAPDVELALKSVVFPTVYGRLMKGDPDYHLETIPTIATEVVRQAHELIRDTRAELDVAVTDPKYWEKFAPRFQSWVAQTMLPALYNDTDPAWVTDEPLNLEQMKSWQKNVAGRVFQLPTIFDAYDSLEQVSDEHGTLDIGIAEFHKLTLETRIDTELPISC